MALNLWNHSIMYDSEEDLENGHISSAYAPSEIFCCSYAPYFWEAIKIRYPEYMRYNCENKYNTLENIIVYIRGVRDNSIYKQKQEIENYCKRHNINFQNVYIDDGYSGTTMDRPEIKKIIEDIKNNKIDKILISSVDRISRNMSDWIEFTKLCNDKEVEIITIDGSLEDTKKYIETLKENILLDIFNYKDNQQGTEDEEELI